LVRAEFDTEANEWSTLAPMPNADCCAHRACVLEGLIYIMGAGNGNEVLRFDPASEL
jgi:hypothetical protein